MNKWFRFFLLVLTLPLFANTPADVGKADKYQKKIIRDLESEIASYHLSLQALYKPIYKTGLIKNNKTRIPLLAQRKIQYERRQEHIYNAEATIYWNGSSISFIQIWERSSELRSDNQKQRYWLGQIEVVAKTHTTDSDKKPRYEIRGYSVDFITFQRMDSGDVDPLLFRVNTATDTKGSSTFLKLPKHELNVHPEVRYVEEPKHRIQILRDYLRLIILVEHRAKYFTRKARLGAEDRLRSLLPKP